MEKPTGTNIAKTLALLAVIVAGMTGLALIAKDPAQQPVRKQKLTIEAPNRVDPYASYFYGRK